MQLLFRLCTLFALATAIPMQVTINQRSTECLYDTLEAGESVTMSVFVLAGAELKATATLEGPVAPLSAQTGKDIQAAIAAFDNDEEKYGDHSIIHHIVDFEHLVEEIDEGDDDDDDDIDDNYDDDEEISEEEERKRQEERRRRDRARQRRREARRRERERREAAQKNVRDQGEPMERTMKAQAAGWYRACVKGTWYQITAEIEMRKESDLEGIDPETGHVFSYERQLRNAEEKLLDEDTASQEEGIDDKDFEKTRDLLRKLRRLLSDIQSKQTTERHRLVVHSATNEHSHSRMVLSSLFETVLFMAVTGFQVYTIRKWFSGAPALGR